MGKSKLSALTIDELHKQKRSLNGMVLGTGIILLILCGVLLYLINKSRSFSLLPVVPCCLLIVIPGIIKLSQVNAEIKSRRSY